MNDLATTTEREQRCCESVVLPAEEQRERTIRGLRAPRRTRERPYRRPGAPGWIRDRLISAGSRLLRGAARPSQTPAR